MCVIILLQIPWRIREELANLASEGKKGMKLNLTGQVEKDFFGGRTSVCRGLMTQTARPLILGGWSTEYIHSGDTAFLSDPLRQLYLRSDASGLLFFFFFFRILLWSYLQRQFLSNVWKSILESHGHPPLLQICARVCSLFHFHAVELSSAHSTPLNNSSSLTELGTWRCALTRAFGWACCCAN